VTLLPGVGLHQFDKPGTDCCVSHRAGSLKFAVDGFRQGVCLICADFSHYFLFNLKLFSHLTH